MNRDILTTLVKENYVARVDRMYEMMPERTALMYDETAKASSSIDGVSYALSQSGSIDRNEGILIRKDWLDKLGLQIPVIARLLEWMSTDGYITVVYGEEAENYMLDDEGRVVTDGLQNPALAYTQKAAAPLLQLRNLVFHNGNKELMERYPAWTSKNGKVMNPFKLLREMQKCTWTIGVNIPGASKELKTFYEDGIRDFVAGRRKLETWELWLKEFDRLGGADWERRCLLYAEQNALLLDNVYATGKDVQ